MALKQMCVCLGYVLVTTLEGIGKGTLILKRQTNWLVPKLQRKETGTLIDLTSESPICPILGGVGFM